MLKEISTQAKIRFADCDPIGHLNNVKYLEYMLNAREDHVEQQFGFTYEEFTRQTGYTWIAIQNEIAYLKEVKYNSTVKISSHLIDFTGRTSKVEVRMTNLEGTITHAVLWITVIYFNLKTRKSELPSEETVNTFIPFLDPISHNQFSDRVAFFRASNKKII